jgi:hypothetical protein
MQMQEKANHKTNWKIEKYFAKDSQEIAEKGITPFEVIEFEDNILVNAGINALLTLLAGAGGNAFNNANSYLGVGDSSTAADATQTDLQAATNKLRKAMNATYPTYGTSQKITFQSDFTSAEANFAWEEFAAFNAAAAGTMLNRKVSSQGTKVSGQTWKLQLEITIS